MSGCAVIPKPPVGTPQPGPSKFPSGKPGTVQAALRRRIEVPLAIRPDRLHRVFRILMSWKSYHLYGFRIGRNTAYDEPDPDWDLPGSSPRPVNRTTMAQPVAQTRKETFKYVYDFGNDGGMRSNWKRSSRRNPRSSTRACSRKTKTAQPPRSASQNQNRLKRIILTHHQRLCFLQRGPAAPLRIREGV
jgi:hypothetical protein